MDVLFDRTLINVTPTCINIPISPTIIIYSRWYVHMCDIM